MTHGQGAPNDQDHHLPVCRRADADDGRCTSRPRATTHDRRVFQRLYRRVGARESQSHHVHALLLRFRAGASRTPVDAGDRRLPPGAHCAGAPRAGGPQTIQPRHDDRRAAPRRGPDGVAAGYRRARRAVSRLHVSARTDEWRERPGDRDADGQTSAPRREGRGKLPGDARSGGRPHGGGDQPNRSVWPQRALCRRDSSSPPPSRRCRISPTHRPRRIRS